jgi:hypothetical protein
VTVPKHRLPDRPMAPDLAYEIIHQELLKRLLPRLEKQPSPARDESYTSFSH